MVTTGTPPSPEDDKLSCAIGDYVQDSDNWQYRKTGLDVNNTVLINTKSMSMNSKAQ